MDARHRSESARRRQHSSEARINLVSIQRHETEIGELVLGSFGGKLCLLGFGGKKMRRAVDASIRRGLDAGFVERDDEILEKTRKQVDEYLTGNREEFDIPLLMVGTDFQRGVWKALMKVPYGVTSTYGQIAQDIGSPKAVRAVGNASSANPISIIVPCHRIIGSNGQLVGYGGGLSVKKRLLKLEQRDTSSWREGACALMTEEDAPDKHLG
ncbi:MAG: methylated-DNA--[protein]-cysteine S-methyltransferase [Dehalococcoidia bacterium]